MTTRVYTKHSHFVETDDGEFELTFEPYDSDAVRVEVVGSRAVVGYLCYDEDCQNPLEWCDGMGHIYSSHRDSSTHEEMQEALGLNNNWEPDLESLREDAEIAAILEAVKKINDSFDNGTTVLLVEYSHRDYQEDVDVYDVVVQYPKQKRTLKAFEAYAWNDSGRQHVVTFRGNVQVVRDWDEVALEMWREGRRNGTIGNKYAVMLDVYDHGGTSCSVSGEGMQCMWDTAHGGAVWVPDKCLIEDIESYPEDDKRRRRVIELARQACEEYTAWCNGECYGVVVETFTLVGDGDDAEWQSNDDNEACWGYIGFRYAESEMESDVARTKKEIETNAS